MAKSEQLEHSYKHHQNIITSLRDGNEDAAKRALSANWEYAMKFLIAALTQDTAKSF